MTTITTNAATPRTWIKRAGVYGFWFFLIKGLLWLAAPLALYFLT